jgi:hypothetical protein
MTNTKELRAILAQEIKSLRSGDTTSQRARAVSGLAHKAISSLRLDIEDKRLDMKITKSIPRRKNSSVPSLKL